MNNIIRRTPLISTILSGILVLFSSLLQAAEFSPEDITHQLALLTSNSVYNLDNEELPVLLRPFLQKYKSIKALKIVESDEDEILILFYRNKKKLYFNQTIPENLLKLEKFTSEILYNNKEVGYLTLYYKDLSTISFTPKEQRWINANKPIHYVYDSNWEPLEWSNELGKHSGMIADLLKIIKKSSQLNLVEISTNNWSDAVKKVKDNQADMFSGVGITVDRKKYLRFTSNNILTVPYVFVSRLGENFFNGFSDLKGKIIAVNKNSTIQGLLKESYPETKLTLLEMDGESGFIQLQKKKIDIYVINLAKANYYIGKLGFNNLQVVYSTDLKLQLKIAIRKEIPDEVLSILNKSIALIDPNFISELLYKYTNSDTLFTNEEKKYLKKKKILKICSNPNWAPIEFKVKDKINGISIDILETMHLNLGLKREFVKTKSWKESQQFLKDRKCDVLLSAIKTTKREKYANFTKSYLNYELIMVTHKDAPEIQSLKQLINKKMSRKKGSGLISKLKKQYPNINITESDSTLESFQMVADGRVDFTISTLPVFLYHKSKYGLNNTKLAGTSSMRYNLSIAVRNDDRLLLNILNKSLQEVPETTYQLVHEKWATIKVVDKINWDLMIKIVAVIFILLLFVLWNNKKLQSMVKEKTLEITKLLSSFDKNVIAIKSDNMGIITYVSKAFCKVTGFKENDLVGKNQELFRNPEVPEKFFEVLWAQVSSGEQWRGEIKNLKKNGDFYWVDTIITPDFDKQNNFIGTSAISQDITAKKAVEDLTVNLEIKIDERTKDLLVAKKEIEASHKHTRESIEYASLIQSALLPDEKLMANYFNDYFVHWMPKDTVGGDIWLFNELRHKDECLLFFIDCTGHGVPGAFVTMIVKAVEREIITKIKDDNDVDISPSWVMSYFNQIMKVLLKQETMDSKSNAGWDGGIIYYNKKDKIIKFAGAETPLFYINAKGEFKTIKGNRYSVGYKKCNMDYEYKETIIAVEKGMKFYCTTDGYLDQNGGTKDFPFGKKRFGNIIKENHSKVMSEQKQIFIDEMDKYESMIENNDRNDDMTVIVFEI